MHHFTKMEDTLLWLGYEMDWPLSVALSPTIKTDSHLITNSSSLNPLGHFEVAHGQVEPTSLKKRLSLILRLPFQRDLVLQEVYHLTETKVYTIFIIC